jgi:hypothetical protein
MSVEDDLRLAWQAARDGRPGMRDSLLTLALAASGPGDVAWAERCWKRLVTDRSDHLFAGFSDLERALADERVATRLERLRALFHPRRVERLLGRADVLRGAFTGRRASLSILLEELLGPETPRRSRHADTPTPAPLLTLGPAARRPAVSSGPNDLPGESDAEDLFTLYLTVLLAIAILLAGTLRVSDRGSQAA